MARGFIEFAGMPTEKLTRYKVLHDIPKAEKYEEMVEDYVEKFKPPL